jgi:hypothetical protein
MPVFTMAGVNTAGQVLLVQVSFAHQHKGERKCEKQCLPWQQ